MPAAEEHLVRRSDGLILLFAPPFDSTSLDPGYIKGYPPGIRENGGQYTHGAVWSAIAFAVVGDGDKAAELFSLLNPIHHSSTRAAIHRYKVEPYVACADVYAAPPHVGRGGWTWYTGAGGWLYRAGLEGILGSRVQGATLVLDPCIPRAWPGFELDFRQRSARYEIRVENPQARQARCLLRSAEIDLLGFDHAQIGGDLLKKWMLPPTLERAVADHHQPADSQYAVEAAAVYLADILVNALGIGTSGERLVPPLDAHAWEALELSPSCFEVVIQQTLHQLNTLEFLLPENRP